MGQLVRKHRPSMEVERKDVSVGKIRAKDLPVVCVLGGPGSGKGSQCEILAYKRNLKHLSSGDLLRHEVLSGSQVGQKVYKLMEMGELVPTTVVLDILAEAMIKAIDDGADGYLLDAFPMNLEQAEAFESFIGSPARIIYLSLAQDVMVSRLLDRANFDDKEEAIKKRCATFQEECRPVLDKYSQKLVKDNEDFLDQRRTVCGKSCSRHRSRFLMMIC